MLRRHLADELRASLADNPVTLLVGPRQSGKSTLAQLLIGEGHAASYLTLDDAATLAAAASDPEGFVRGLGGPAVIDEVQRVPELLPAIKVSVDGDRRAGRFLLTGSANVLLLPRVSESLAGRMEVHTLWPFSQGEIAGRREVFLDRLLGDAPVPRGSVLSSENDVVERVLRGGFPPAVERSGRRRDAWLASYVGAVLQRDVRDLANVQRLTELPHLLALLAARTSGLLNLAELGRAAGVPQSTLQRYVTLLEHVFLVVRLPSWHTNIGTRLVKAPKLHLVDSGLAAHALAATPERMGRDRTLLGSLLESFVAMELLKQCSWSVGSPRLHHYRTAKGAEVDLVVEDRGGAIAGVEVKAGATIGAGDFRGLRELADAHGDRFVRGIVLYRGNAIVPFGERLAAWPIQALWAG
jgi:uncharacterized protein